MPPPEWGTLRGSSELIFNYLSVLGALSAECSSVRFLSLLSFADRQVSRHLPLKLDVYCALHGRRGLQSVSNASHIVDQPGRSAQRCVEREPLERMCACHVEGREWLECGDRGIATGE